MNDPAPAPAPAPAASAKGKRPCPALGGPISPVECGTRRGTQLSCPAHCPFFPFGTAAPELWDRLVHRWNEKAFEYVMAKAGKPRFNQTLRLLASDGDNRESDMSAPIESAVYTLLFLPAPDQGLAPVERWEAERWAGLNHDEQLMMHYRRQSRLAVFEIQRFEADPAFIECLDLLAPGSAPFRLWAPELDRRVPRFAHLFGWLTPYPHFSWPGHNLRAVPRDFWPAWRAEIERRYQAAAAVRPGLALSRFLMETVADCERLFDAIFEQRKQQILAEMDFHRCTARYGYAVPQAEIAAAFRDQPEFVPEAPEALQSQVEPPLAAYVWKPAGVPSGSDPAPGSPAPAADARDEDLGFLALYPDHLLLEVATKRRFALARNRIEAQFANRLRFETETITDLHEYIRAQTEGKQAVQAVEAAVFGEPVPSETEPGATEGSEGHDREAEFEEHRRRYREMLERPHPALEGKTPRAAAVDPALRPRLIELMKDNLLHLDRHRLQTGIELPLDWLLDELGLSELK